LTLSLICCPQEKYSPKSVVSVREEHSEEPFSLFLDCLIGIKIHLTDGKQK